MRIRKNSKLIKPLSSSFLVCQLNRSPWDVDDHSLSIQDERAFTASNNLPQPHFTTDSGAESMELSFEYVEKILPPQPPSPPPPLQLPIDDYDERIDVGNGWQNIHHQLKPPPLNTGRTLPPIPKKRGRPRKHGRITVTTTTATANNNYSGSGPPWSGDSNAEQFSGSSSSSTITTMNYIWNDNNNDNGVKRVEEELDYIEDDLEDDDGYFGRRVRKPVKARSLKSLM